MNSRFLKYIDAEPKWSSPVIVESHINGLRTKDYNQNIPIGYDEIAADAIKCWEAGAGGIHVHNSSIRLAGEDAYEDYMKAMRPVMEVQNIAKEVGRPIARQDEVKSILGLE